MDRSVLCVATATSLAMSATGAIASEAYLSARKRAEAAELVARVLAEPPAATRAADDSAEPTLDADADKYRTDWKIQIEPLMWYWSPAGKIRLPANSGTGAPSGGGFSDSGSRVKASELNIDTPRFSPAGEAHFSIDRFRVTLSGAAYEIDRDGTPADEAFRIGSVEVAAGDELDVSFQFATAELTLGYNVWSKDFAADTDAERAHLATPLVLRTYILGGARLYSTDIGVRNLANGASADASELFIEPVLGARAELEIAEAFTIDLQISAGYWADSDQSVSSVDIAVGFMYRPHPNVGLQLGWRQLAFDLSDGEGVDEFEFDGQMAGVYAGITLSF